MFENIGNTHIHCLIFSAGIEILLQCPFGLKEGCGERSQGPCYRKSSLTGFIQGEKSATTWGLSNTYGVRA